ncbi:MAG: DUF4258 domain-containing protein [Nitrospirota bacterium]
MDKAEEIRKLVAAGQYTLSKHAEREREADRITIEELEKALAGCEVIEDCPDDPRGASFLALGFAGSRPVHAVCALKQDPGELLLITVYDPSKSPERWAEGFRRRRT